jgi:hypothetical protein
VRFERAFPHQAKVTRETKETSERTFSDDLVHDVLDRTRGIDLDQELVLVELNLDNELVRVRVRLLLLLVLLVLLVVRLAHRVPAALSRDGRPSRPKPSSSSSCARTRAVSDAQPVPTGARVGRGGSGLGLDRKGRV